MQIDHAAVPDIARADAGLALVGEWSTSEPEHQQRAAEAVLGAWQRVSWPAGLLAHSCLLGEDGHSVLHYSQWADQDAARAFADSDKRLWVRAVDTAVPGIEHRKVTAYRPYRNTAPAADRPPTRCLVTVTVDLDEPGAQHQRGWVDNVFAAAGTTEASPANGMLAAHFHLSIDGSRVLNLAEWTTAQAHRDATSSTTTSSAQFRSAVVDFPGVVTTDVRRYLPYRCITASSRSCDDGKTT